MELSWINHYFNCKKKAIIKSRRFNWLLFNLVWPGRGLLIEPFRTDPLYIGALKVNILFSIVLFAVGGASYLVVKNILRRDLPYYLDLVNENKEKLKNEKS